MGAGPTGPLDCTRNAKKMRIRCESGRARKHLWPRKIPADKDFAIRKSTDECVTNTQHRRISVATFVTGPAVSWTAFSRDTGTFRVEFAKEAAYAVLQMPSASRSVFAWYP